MIRRPPRSTQSRSSAASDVYKRQSLQSHGLVGRSVAQKPTERRDPVRASNDQRHHRGGVVRAEAGSVLRFGSGVFDTTSIYFHGEGGESIGKRGHLTTSEDAWHCF